jgi:hypothetical protein
MKELSLWTDTATGFVLDDYEADIRSRFGAERTTGFFCHAEAGCVKSCRPSSHRFGEFHERGVLRQASSTERQREAPTWKTAIVYFSDAYAGESFARYSVPRTSARRPAEPVDYAARLADRESRLAEAKPTSWAEPPTCPIDRATLRELKADDEIQNEATVASRRRLYNADEVSIQKRWHNSIFSQVKFDALDDPEDRVAHHWRYIDRQYTDPAEADLTSAFSRMLYRSEEINKKVEALEACNAKGEACRSYQASAFIRTYYLVGRRLSAADIICADLVVEAIHEHLRRDGKIDWTARTAILDMLEGASAREVAAKHKLRSHKSLQERYGAETASIEARFGRYCTDWQPRQNGTRPWYNIGRVEKVMGYGRLTEPTLTVPQPYSDKSNYQLRFALAHMRVLARGWLAHGRRKLLVVPGLARDYDGTAEIDRQYPTQPYGSEPLIIWRPQSPYDFGNEASTALKPALGVPLGNNFQPWSASWMTKGIKHKTVPEYFPLKLRGKWRGAEDVEKPKTKDDDLVDKLRAHGERGDDRISRAPETHGFEDGFDRTPRGRDAHEVDDGDNRITRLRGSSYEVEAEE